MGNLSTICFLSFGGDIFFVLLLFLYYLVLGIGVLYLMVLGIKLLRRKLAKKDAPVQLPVGQMMNNIYPHYVNLYDTENNKFLIDYTLTDLEKKLSPFFMRVHRSYIINKHLIKEIRRHSGSKFTLVLKDKANRELVSSQSYALEIKKLMEI